MQWNQTPPNMSDYDPDCLQSSALGPFQTAPPEDKEKSSKRVNTDKHSGPPQKVPKREPKVVEQGQDQDVILSK